jgi:hypothetical protein
MARSSGGLLFEHHHGNLPTRFFLILAIGRIQCSNKPRPGGESRTRYEDPLSLISLGLDSLRPHHYVTPTFDFVCG